MQDPIPAVVAAIGIILFVCLGLLWVYQII